ncbi:hypothetical protein LVJ94_45755 [Pendulispora rubella]|uniref:Uncharacterized protein n=1 Tax=Pendulispora rubella TaxID=2741070 RepID=A0ABZ2L3Q9_9BACT
MTRESLRMGRGVWVVGLTAFAATCVSLSPIACSSSDNDEPLRTADASSDTLLVPPAPCDLSKDFGAPTTVPGLPTGAAKGSGGRLSPDELAIYYDDGKGLVAATRPDRSSPFTTKAWFDAVNSGKGDYTPWVSADGRTVFFVSGRTDGAGTLFRAERSDTGGAFGPAKEEPVRPFVNGVTEPYVRENVELWFGLRSGTDARIARSAIASDGGFEPAAAQSELREGSSSDGSPVISSDGLTIFFASKRPTSVDYDIWTATRASATGTFSKPTRVPSLSTAYSDSPTWISSDSCRLYLTSDRPEGTSDAGANTPHIWVSARPH